jgi:hypothetical protein
MAERPEACAAWREDLAAWLVAQIGPDREAALEEHLAGCAACREEADSLSAVAAVSLAADPAPERAPVTARADDDLPPADLGARITARIAAERRGGTLRRGALVALGCAAAAVVLVVGVLVAGGGGGADLEPLEGDDYAFTVGTGEAIVAADPDTGGSIVHLEASQLDPELTYALWLAVPGGGRDDRIPAGTFQPEPDGTVVVRLQSAMPPDEAGRVWATTPDFQLALDTEPPSPDAPIAEPWR